MKTETIQNRKSFEFGRYVAIADVKEDNKVYVTYEYLSTGNTVEEWVRDSDMEIVLGMARNWCEANGLTLWSY
ncbi:hypothetical protein SAMN05421821_105155 [Mucilaginibacter lappiensis]|uniref:Uncharacterized protein n=1 Tax=Mucilaginibacter lappiensis TaxID=354630 RepID=A0ABR6PIZ8_9SPHI|nr:hypothetical protein [Mucilaginibacter lappiensis]MBB6109737.1 hypothetical protein [Mucilaginibacter lappiensis]SIR13694.1 hypothetical protein SAMN05421821_105155 [Mucilaginibacter lappiensis]